MKYLLSSLLVLSLALCCTKKKKSQITESIPFEVSLTGDSISKLIDNALNLGDLSSYNKASSYFFLRDKSEDFLFTSFIMANKYNCSEAYYHVYKILNSTRNQEKLDSLDEQTKRIALFYLLRSYEMGYSQSKYEIENIFRKGERIPKSSFYLKVF